MIHMGAMVGGNLTQGRSRTLNYTSNFLTRFRNSQDRRDFITGGAAAGVSAAFGAPIGLVSYSIPVGFLRYLYYFLYIEACFS